MGIPAERRTELEPHLKHERVQVDVEKIEREGVTPDLGAALSLARRLVESSRLPKKEKGQLLELVQDVEERALSYIEAFTKHVLQESRRETVGLRDPERYQRNVDESDQRRRIAHNAFVDALNIMSRNLLQRGFDGIRPYAEKLAGQPNDLAHRRRVGDAALKFVWEELKKEAEREEREEKSL